MNKIISVTSAQAVVKSTHESKAIDHYADYSHPWRWRGGARVH